MRILLELNSPHPQPATLSYLNPRLSAHVIAFHPRLAWHLSTCTSTDMHMLHVLSLPLSLLQMERRPLPSSRERRGIAHRTAPG